MTQHYIGGMHVFELSLEPTHSGKQQAWYIHKRKRNSQGPRKESHLPVEGLLLRTPIFSHQKAKETALRLANEDKATALLLGHPL